VLEALGRVRQTAQPEAFRSWSGLMSVQAPCGPLLRDKGDRNQCDVH
jgi:hypothetical protein